MHERDHRLIVVYLRLRVALGLKLKRRQGHLTAILNRIIFVLYLIAKKAMVTKEIELRVNKIKTKCMIQTRKSVEMRDDVILHHFLKNNIFSVISHILLHSPYYQVLLITRVTFALRLSHWQCKMNGSVKQANKELREGEKHILQVRHFHKQGQGIIILANEQYL